MLASSTFRSMILLSSQARGADYLRCVLSWDHSVPNRDAIPILEGRCRHEDTLGICWSDTRTCGIRLRGTMSDRKYRQRGYQDEDRREPAPKPQAERPPREMRAPNVPGFHDVVRCARCGDFIRTEIVQDSRCQRCGADLHSCAQCGSFDAGSRFECTQPIPARISPKDARNTCTLFAPRVTVERETGSAGPPNARKAFDDLFR